LKHVVYLGLGSNVGDRIEYLAAAIRGLSDFEMTVIDDVSNVYETEPVGNVPQQEFLNLCVSIKTDLEYQNFHKKIKELEQAIGRSKSERWGPREIDIDLLFFDSIIFDTEFLTIPHREIINRKFVLQPLSEIAPLFVHPVYKKSIAELNNSAADTHAVVSSEHHTTQLYTLLNDSITNPTI